MACNAHAPLLVHMYEASDAGLHNIILGLLLNTANRAKHDERMVHSSTCTFVARTLVIQERIKGAPTRYVRAQKKKM